MMRAPDMRRTTAPHPHCLAATVLALATLSAAAETTWTVVGRQGLMQVVIVPREQATDLAAYRAQVPKLCAPDTTCFINFFTNSTGAELALPLPDAIAAEATARFRRSTKNGVEVFQWSCRMGPGTPDCF